MECQYQKRCGRWDCQYEACFHTCTRYIQIKEGLLEQAVREARHWALDRDDIKFIADFYQVPAWELEKRLNQGNK